MSGAPEPPVPLGALREAVERAIAASSVRAVAERVGLAHTGLMKFRDGAKPQARTLRKLIRWYVQESAGASQDAGAFSAALAVLLDGYPPNQRERVRAELVEVLRKGHQAAGTDPPEWLKG